MLPLHIEDDDGDRLTVEPFQRPVAPDYSTKIQLYRIEINDTPDGVNCVNLTREQLRQLQDYINRVIES